MIKNDFPPQNRYPAGRKARFIEADRIYHVLGVASVLSVLVCGGIRVKMILLSYRQKNLHVSVLNC